MDLMLRAFGNSEKYTLKERANRIIHLHMKFSSMVGQYKWNLLRRKKENIEIDITDTEGSYPHVLQQVKSGLNAKVAKPIKYAENDIADISSSCYFYNDSFDKYHVEYFTGYPTRTNLWGMMIGIDKIRDPNLFTKELLHNIAILYITDWQPDMLCVTDRDYFHNRSKPFEDNLAWTGWFTYLSHSLIAKQKKSLIGNLFSQDFLKDIRKLSIVEVENTSTGVIIWSTDEIFSNKNPDHVEQALAVQNIFKKYKIPSLIE